MTIKEVLDKGTQFLKEYKIEDSRLISKILLGYILKCNKEDLIIKQNASISKKQEEFFLKCIKQISRGYPIQYITNTREFMGLNIYVDENVLIPRPDTEILVEKVIEICKENGKKDILELCTGSGAIAIALSKYLSNVNITATDISGKALKVAKMNETNLLTDSKINFIQSDMFNEIQGKYDIIVSNPPYIKTKVIDEYILKYEPKLALDGGEDGLKFYEIIINEGSKYLKENGIIALEIGYDQKEEVMELVRKSNKYKESYCIKDLSNNDRVIVIS